MLFAVRALARLALGIELNVIAPLPEMMPEIWSGLPGLPRAPVVRAALRIVLPEPESEPMVSAEFRVKLPEFATAEFSERPPLVLRPAPLAIEIAVLPRLPARTSVPAFTLTRPA